MGFYAHWMDRWERTLATRDTNRVVRDFEWGLDWLHRLNPECPASANGDAPAHMDAFVASALADSERFFAYEPPRDFRLEGNHLTFTSPVVSPFSENNRVHADLFAAGDKRRAVVVLPQWNASAEGHAGLCKLLNRFGITALRMSLAYHDRRMPPELERADYHLSSNIGRTIHASRQSIIDVRCCLDWLGSQGYQRLGIVGTSLGSCVAFIATAHDPRVSTAVFNHVSMYFGDVVWTGLATQHVRRSLSQQITHEQLRHYWSMVSPASYLHRLHDRDLKTLLVWARHDSTFLPVYSQQVLEWFRSNSIPHERFTLPCGHYTTGRFPFNLLDGMAMCRFLQRNL